MRRIRFGIRLRLLLSALLPALAIVVTLELVFLSHYQDYLERSFVERGQAISRQIGVAAEYALFTGSSESLRMLADAARQRDPTLLAVSVLDRQGRSVVHSGVESERTLPLAPTQQVSSSEKVTLVQAPILQSTLPLDDAVTGAWRSPSRAAAGSQPAGYVRVEISREELALRKREMVQITLAIMLAGLALVGWLSMWIANSAVVTLDAAQETLLRQMEAAEILARTDTLTGLANRRAFDEVAEQEIQRAQRYSTPLALIMTDLDHFKRINDCYGHRVGDHVLRHFADVLKASVRTIDLVGRWGGEEFALLLPGTDLAEAAQAAERMRVTVAAALPRIEGNDCAYTASFGVAAFNAATPTLTALLGRADAALYRAKEQGRNRVECG